ncbi:hypothetical protein KUTeg_021202 [Tegillarca granosa]|uniref:Thioredoxin-like protein 4B n=1 Tax=Tegillarca granosa TaxID=220873 RepID=A0ABQ9EFD0_TEGGR|nr:hypothetical protein KUTeg_021202 [Tegillarca granosa]
MSFFLPKLESKREVDDVIRSTEDIVLVLRFGRENDSECLKLDDILAKTAPELAKMASIYTVEVDKVPTKQDFIDVVETIFRGAMKGKLMVMSPIDPQNIPKYDLLYQDI